MKTAILGALAAMLCAASGLRLDFTNYTFESYVSEFGKTTYSAAEHKRHAVSALRGVLVAPLPHALSQATFEENRAFIVSQNMKYAAGQSTWYAGVNKFTDMTQAEVNKFKGYDRAEVRGPWVVLCVRVLRADVSLCVCLCACLRVRVRVYACVAARA
jgi:hypothetical protein